VNVTTHGRDGVAAGRARDTGCLFWREATLILALPVKAMHRITFRGHARNCSCPASCRQFAAPGQRRLPPTGEGDRRPTELRPVDRGSRRNHVTNRTGRAEPELTRTNDEPTEALPLRALESGSREFVRSGSFQSAEAQHEYRSTRVRSGTRQARKAIAIERPQETVNIIVVVRRKIVAVTASQLKRDGIRFAQTQRSTFVVAVIPSRKPCRGNGATALLPELPGAEPSQNKPPRRPCAPAS